MEQMRIIAFLYKRIMIWIHVLWMWSFWFNKRKSLLRTIVDYCVFLSSGVRASERCHQEKRKTINGEDILFAMQTLGFDHYVEPLKQYLQKYREVRPMHMLWLK